jgi:flagellar assembly protein FliH
MIKTSDLSSKNHSSSVGSPEEVLQVTGIQKFLFDCSFDDEISGTSDKTVEIVKEEEPEELIPSFSEEELKIAKDEAFTKGKEQGIKETIAAREQSLLDMIGNLEMQFENLFKTQQETDKSNLKSAILVATSISRKIFPSLNKRGALEEVENLVTTIMKEILEEPKVSICIHPDLEPLLIEHIGSISKKASYRGEINIIASEDILLGDCKIEWKSGGAQRNTESLLLEIDEVIDRNLQEAFKMVTSDDQNFENETTVDKEIGPEQLGS